MIRKINSPMMWKQGVLTPCEGKASGTIAQSIFETHNVGNDPDALHIKFDAMASHDITYVSIIQTARASGMTRFPLPYVLTNCHNSLCAVGGTINEDDHAFGYSAAVKYGGAFVGAHQSVIHQYMREKMAGCGKMILGSDSHTRYGALGCLGVGEGGPELVKQLLSLTWDAPHPEIVAVELTGAPRKGVGPMDVALALVAATFPDGFVKNRVLEFIGDGIANLSCEYRMGIDVMTTETTCLTSVWQTDEIIRAWLALHGREADYAPLMPKEGAVYDRAIQIDLSKVEPMIALPFHPSNALPIREFLKDPAPVLARSEAEASKMMANPPSLQIKIRNGGVWADQAEIAGCSGGMYENLCAAADILKDNIASLAPSVYPASAPMQLALYKDGAAADLLSAGATMRSAFCGPCFGAGDVPKNGGLSLRHATRNFPSREGSKPAEGQLAYVALMDARSIAATCLNGGKITPADEIDWIEREHPYTFDDKPYKARVYEGFNNPQPDEPLVFGPNIADWPEMPALAQDLVLYVASAITDPVTTTDELIPSGETSSYRSNPLRLAEFALSRRDPGYVGRAKAAAQMEKDRKAGTLDASVAADLKKLGADNAAISSLVFSIRPGDGSAREQAASCQRVLGGGANICREYATKRYRSNVINWGMLPFTMADAAEHPLSVGDWVYVPGIRAAVENGQEQIEAKLLHEGVVSGLQLTLSGLSDDDRRLLLTGCLINAQREASR